MNSKNSFIAELIESSAGAYASYAAQLLLERRPEAAERFGTDPFAGWRDHLRGRLYELAASIETDEPRIFANRVAWTRQAFEARGVPIEDVREALGCLREVLEEKLPERNRIDLSAYFEPAEEALEGFPMDGVTPLRADTPGGRIAAEYLLAVLEGDRHRASRVVLDAIPDRITVEQAYREVLVPAEIELGRMWHLNELTVGEELFATSVTEMVIAQLYALIDRKPWNGKVLLASPTETNRHGIGIRIISDFFEMEGWRVILLDQPLPGLEFAQTCKTFKADVVALSASMSVHLRSAMHLIQAVRSEPGLEHVKVLVGGMAFMDSDDLWQRVGADGYASSPETALATAARFAGLAHPHAAVS